LSHRINHWCRQRGWSDLRTGAVLIGSGPLSLGAEFANTSFSFALLWACCCRFIRCLRSWWLVLCWLDIGPSRGPSEIASRQYFMSSMRGIGSSFQLAITAPRNFLIGYGNATAQSWCGNVTDAHLRFPGTQELNVKFAYKKGRKTESNNDLSNGFTVICQHPWVSVED